MVTDPTKPITRLVCMPLNGVDPLQLQTIANQLAEQLEQIDPTVNWVVLGGISSIHEIPTPVPAEDGDANQITFKFQGHLVDTTDTTTHQE